MKKVTFLLFLLFPLLSLATMLVPATLTPGTQGTLNENKLYLGINWQIGMKSSFDAIFGFRATHSSSSGSITGGDLNIGIPIDKEHFRDIKLKAEYIKGNTIGQGALGVGYIFGRDKFLGTVGYNFPHVKIGADYALKDELKPYLQINTLNKYKKPASSQNTYSCPSPISPNLIYDPIFGYSCY